MYFVGFLMKPHQKTVICIYLNIILSQILQSFKIKEVRKIIEKLGEYVIIIFSNVFGGNFLVRNRENNIKTFIASFIFVVIIAAAAACGAILFGGEGSAAEDEYSWIVSDTAAVDGMLDGSYYSGEKNSAGVLSYKIAEEITVGTDGKGNFKIENSGKNTCLMKVKILIDGVIVYETGYIKPNQHINEDMLDRIPDIGTYSAEAYFEGFDPNTEMSIGATKTPLTITVIQ